MRKRIALATLAMVPFSVSHANEAELVGIVTAETLNIRSGQGSNDEVLFTVKKGDKVTIIETCNGWHKIQNDEGKEGWVSSSYISLSEGIYEESTSRSSTIQKEVNTNGLNMRSGPSTSYRSITKINKGTKVEVISESNGWSKIKYDGRIGYVYSTYLSDIEPSYTNTTTKTVNTDSLNVRSGPSTSYSIVGKINKGTKVEVISESNGWSKIVYNGKECYVSSRYLDEESYNSGNTDNEIITTKIVNTDSLNVRSGPSTSYSKLGTLSKGSKVEVISESNGWSKIVYNGKEAYVSSTYLSDNTSNDNNTGNDTNTSVEIKIVNTDSLNVRSGPSTSYSKLGTLSKGSKVEVISESNGWSKIVYNGKEAYVSSTYLSDNTSNDNNTGNDTNTSVEIKIVNTDSLNVRSGPSTSYSKLGTLSKGSKVEVISESNGWSKITYNGKEAYVSSMYLSDASNDSSDSSSSSNGIISGVGTFTNLQLNYTFEQHLAKQVEVANSGYNKAPNGTKATRSQIEEKLNPSKILSSSSYGKLQFLRIDRYTEGITASELNQFLNSNVSSTNVFYNKGQQFIDAAKKYNIDVMYFVAHSMWETNYGKSTLAKGQILTSYKGQPLSSPVTVYNFFGIGAFDGSANLSGAETAYLNGWTTVDATIDGSAKWVAANYIHRSAYNQNTVYKMKWNNGTHQYATDINWCNGIAGIMNKLIGYYDDQSKLLYENLLYK
ncbi:SH3 domain-containing protein [Romboutsia sp. 1001713B170207_170306_H8]|uniref:SH3 domain-containing protein n=1 Tax=Romboutsia sp. 1001713B170207_170306_H8 TaxID=2787112 RepID=UPI0008226778|nr:SH3 domain-containing protein [Romboutsia sp. 1001713B170207_170306_H8]SCH07312.1 Beta-N-acetylglucosaminidase precursor [uncultured Clostridium sp.]